MSISVVRGRVYWIVNGVVYRNRKDAVEAMRGSR